MTNVYLLKSYTDHGANEIIEVDDETAQALIGQGIARLCVNRDFLIKPQYGRSKAFRKSPSSK